jgi:hypothetical protein
MEIVSFQGWKRCAKLSAGDTEIIVTLDVGPRVMSLSVKGGPNELYVNPKAAGTTGAEEFVSYGGHRLWVGPENWARTYQPDNSPVEHAQEGDVTVFTGPVDRWGIQKQIRIKPVESAGKFELEHRVVNTGAYEVELAPWCLSQMATGGTCLFPQAPFVAHTEDFLPARPLVLWGYTKMTDARWTWGDRVIRFRQDPTKGPQKVGAPVTQGYAGYANHGNLFLKRFAFERGAAYIDYGCNFETFSNEDMLEVEALGPMQKVAPGGAAVLREAWYLIPGVSVPEADDACAEWLEKLAASRPL